MRPARVIILDEFLENKTGHYYEYDKSVMESLALKGIPCELYCRDTVADDIRKELNAQPFFHYNPDLPIRKLPLIGPFLYRFHNWKKIREQIERVVKEQSTSSEHIVFFAPNIFWYNVLPYAKAFGQNHVRALLLYRTSVLEAIDIGQQYKPLIFRLYDWASRLLEKNKEVRFVTDSEVIAKQYTAKYKQSMTVLPIPHVFGMGEITTGVNKPYRLFLPGPARIEKGVETITAALEHLQQQHPDILSQIEVVMQFFGEKEKEQLQALQARMRKLNCKLDFLGKLSSEEYKAQFLKAQIILIPYLNSRGYQARTSGVLAEAIAAAKPFITTSDSWMDDQVKTYGTGLSIRDSSASDLAHAILAMIGDYERHQAMALQAKDAWLAFHSKENFANTFETCC